MPHPYYRYQVSRAIAAVLPRAWGLRLAEAAADAWYRVAKAERRAIQANVQLVTGKRPDERSPIVREVFRNFARYLFEFFHAHRYDHNEIAVEGESFLRQAWQQRRGVIVCTAHLGNWELGAITLHRLGYPTTVLALPHADARTNALFDRQRRRCGVDVITVGPHATKQALGVLRNGGVLGVVGDREFGANGIAVEGWGRSIIMPKGPALLSLRTGAPVVPAALTRETPSRLRLRLDPAMWPHEARNTDQPIRTLAQRYTDALARSIQRDPTQWILFQPMAQPSAHRARHSAPTSMVGASGERSCARVS